MNHRAAVGGGREKPTITIGYFLKLDRRDTMTPDRGEDRIGAIHLPKTD
jgi:hypothetical protein